MLLFLKFHRFKVSLTFIRLQKCKILHLIKQKVVLVEIPATYIESVYFSMLHTKNSIVKRLRKVSLRAAQCPSCRSQNYCKAKSPKKFIDTGQIINHFSRPRYKYIPKYFVESTDCMQANCIIHLTQSRAKDSSKCCDFKNDSHF